MSTKAFTSHEESFTGYKKLHQPPREGDYSDSEDENYYDDELPLFDEDAMFCDDDYEPFVDAEEEHKSCIFSGRTVLKPIHWSKISPSKSIETSPSKTSTWWDNTQLVDESKRLVNGVINYSAILPPPTGRRPVEGTGGPRNKREVSKKKKKPGASKSEPKTRPIPSDPRTKPSLGPRQHLDEIQQPTRLCISLLKSNKQCFHKERCRFAHNYADLKECNFGERCKKVIVVSRSETFTYHNKPEGTPCTFKHANESKASYLHRVPHTTPSNGHSTRNQKVN